MSLVEDNLELRTRIHTCFLKESSDREYAPRPVPRMAANIPEGRQEPLRSFPPSWNDRARGYTLTLVSTEDCVNTMKTPTESDTPYPPSYYAPRALVLLSGILLGATAMYLLDPRAGPRRRAIVRDKTLSSAHHYGIVRGKLLRHLRNKAEGVFANATSFLRPEGVSSDAKIAARVRSALGRAIPHPRAIGVAVEHGRVTLRGMLAPHEAGLAVLATERVRGVVGIENLITAPLKPGEQVIQ